VKWPAAEEEDEGAARARRARRPRTRRARGRTRGPSSTPGLVAATGGGEGNRESRGERVDWPRAGSGDGNGPRGST
jgi:hypothetical protein